MQYELAKKMADKYLNILKPYCDRIEIAGSIRRKKKNDIKDVEIVLIPKGSKLLQFKETVEKWRKIKGEAIGKYTQRQTEDGVILDIFIANKNNWGLIFAIRTGSAEYSHKVLANGWVSRGYNSKDGVLIPSEKIPLKEKVFIYEEEDLFNLIGIPYVEPERREING